MSTAVPDHQDAGRVRVVSWDLCRIAQDQADWLRQEDPALTEDAAFDIACQDIDHLDHQWESLLEILTGTLQEIAPAGRFHAEGRNMGWRRRRGFKDFTAHDGRSFLRELLPETECSFTIEREGTILFVTNYHHDAPTGEFYTVAPDRSGPENSS